MTVQSVVREVCSFVGVRPPQGSVFVDPLVDRTSWEFVQLANEMAQRIAYDTRDWKMLTSDGLITGTDTAKSFPLPADYKRLLLTSNMWRSTSTQHPMAFIPDAEDWLRRRLDNRNDVWGEWTMMRGEIFIWPLLPSDTIVRFVYLNKNCINLASSGYGDQFLNDADTFRLDERLLKLAMIWQWKANKGASYAEDLATYEDALSRVAGNDKPSPVLVGPYPISSNANIAYYGPVPPAGTFVGPGP